MQRSKVVGYGDGEMVIFFIPDSDVVHEQVNQQSAEIIIFYIAALELFQPVDDLFFIQVGNGLFLFLEFFFQGFLILLQFYHALDQGFRGQAAFYGLGNIV